MELISRIHARDKLILIAGGLKYLADDLLGFYKNDISNIEQMDLDVLRFIVADYIKYHNT